MLQVVSESAARLTLSVFLGSPADALDFCLIRSRVPCAGAAVFTTNQFCAAPVVTSKAVLASHAASVGGVVINAGCANACTGEQGLRDAEKMVALGGEVASIPNALVMSTGVIGRMRLARARVRVREQASGTPLILI